MKILYIISRLSNKGPVKVLYNIISCIDFENNGIILITLSPEKSDSVIDRFRKLPIKIIQLNSSKYLGLFSSSKKINFIIRELKPDIIQANCLRSMLLVAYAVKENNRLVVIHNYPDEDFTMKHGYTLGKFMAIISRLGFNKMNKLVAVSLPLKEKLEKKYRINLDFINNGIDCEHFKEYKKLSKNELRKQFSISEKSRIFIFLDSLIDLKDPNTCIQGFIKAFDKNPKNKLIILGDGYLFSKLKNEYQNYSNIEFKGFIEEPQKWLLISDYYVSTSLSESFHLSVIESLLLDTPVILSDIDMHKFFFTINPKIGLLFRSGDTEDLREKMVRIEKINFNRPLLSDKVIKSHGLNSKQMSNNYYNLYKNMKDYYGKK